MHLTRWNVVHGKTPVFNGWVLVTLWGYVKITRGYSWNRSIEVTTLHWYNTIQWNSFGPKKSKFLYVFIFYVLVTVHRNNSYTKNKYMHSLRAGSGRNWRAGSGRNWRAGSGRDSVPSWSCSQAVSKSLWHIPLLCEQWKSLMMDRGTVRNM